jgi:hypothetical protein
MPDADYEPEETLFTGPASHGPYHGLILESRFPKGILFVDKQQGLCILYDWSPDARVFYARSDFPVPLRTDAGDNRYRAASEFDYEVRAALEDPAWTKPEGTV